jgi:hypothetical protein
LYHDTILNVEINCVKGLSETTRKFNNVNRDDVLYLDLDLEELRELQHMTVRPHVREVMNDLIMKLTHEVKMMKKNSKGLEAPGTKWTDIVVRTRNILHNTTQKIPVINTMQVSRVQPLPNTKENNISRNLMSTIYPATIELAKEKISVKHKMVLIGDSHARGCTSKLREKLKEQYKVIGYVIPGRDAAVLTKIAQQEISGLTKEDITHILWRNK